MTSSSTVSFRTGFSSPYALAYLVGVAVMLACQVETRHGVMSTRGRVPNMGRIAELSSLPYNSRVVSLRFRRASTSGAYSPSVSVAR